MLCHVCTSAPFSTSLFLFLLLVLFSFFFSLQNPNIHLPDFLSQGKCTIAHLRKGGSPQTNGPVEGGIRVVEEHPCELLRVGPLEMLRHSRAVGPPPSVTILPLPHDHRVSVLLPLGAHPPSRPPFPPCGISHARATHTRNVAAAWEHFRVFPRSPSSRFQRTDEAIYLALPYSREPSTRILSDEHALAERKHTVVEIRDCFQPRKRGWGKGGRERERHTRRNAHLTHRATTEWD